MLWDVVFDFFVKYIFGGVIYDNNVLVRYSGSFGALWSDNAAAYVSGRGTAYAFSNFILKNGDEILRMPIGNYLSFIATIITMVVILVICCALIKKIYNMCAHIIG